ncbi:MAG: uroporphyrinogen-III decarboxylase [Chloroflexi bacterium]|nr:uroporphyrinogen-III decarboxylase [Chloroflexota bacterium]
MPNESIAKHSLYQERFARIKSAIRLEPLDRIPLVFMGIAFAPQYMGMSIAQFCASPEARVDVTLAAMDRLGAEEFDGINALPAGRITAALSSLWLSRLAVPGRDLPDDSLWQVAEAEVLTIEDYDTILDQGWSAFRKSYMPRVIDVAELDANVAWVQANLDSVKQRFHDSGYVPVSFGATTIPFECLCGGRSMQQFFLDLYRIPNKVKATMDVMQPSLIRAGINIARRSGISGVWVGGWRAASALLSPRLWNKFVFPYYLEMVTALAEQEIVSVLHFDQDWTRDLARLREFPAKSCLLNLDGMTDIRKAKEILGDHMAIMGDVPATLFSIGTPDDVYNYVRDLIRDVGPTGLILSPGCDAPLNTKPENMDAFIAASRDFGENHFEKSANNSE